MSLDGLRAWIGVVERKLQMRTRVFLVLVAIAIGGGAAGIYLGAEAQNDQVTESDLQTVQAELEARMETLEAQGPEAGGGAASTEVSELAGQVKELEAKVSALEGQGGTGGVAPNGGGQKAEGKAE